MKLKVYIAGKVSPNSSFGKHDWRDGFCAELNKLTKHEFINLDPTKSIDFYLDENNAELVYGRDCYMISIADLVIVNLSDDISVGGSQEMLIAKYFNKPLIGFLQVGGKFHKEEKEILGKVYKNWRHPFVSVPCDELAYSLQELAEKVNLVLERRKVKGIKLIDKAREYYEKEYLIKDKFLNSIDSDLNK